MRNTVWLNNGLGRITRILAGFLLFVLMFNRCCINREAAASASFYNFDYKGEEYRIRSISSINSTQTFIELIGKKFVARDYDRDRIVDEISLGESNLQEAQTIYEYAMGKLTKENRLRQVRPEIDVFQHENSFSSYEIKSFRQLNTGPFNEFKVFKSSKMVNTIISIAVDQKADGTLDKIIKGTMPLEDLQPLYSNAIKEGIETNQLTSVNNMFLVK